MKTFIVNWIKCGAATFFNFGSVPASLPAASPGRYFTSFPEIIGTGSMTATVYHLFSHVHDPIGAVFLGKHYNSYPVTNIIEMDDVIFVTQNEKMKVTGMMNETSPAGNNAWKRAPYTHSVPVPGLHLLLIQKLRR